VYFDRQKFKEDATEMVDMVCELKKELADGNLPVTPKIRPGDVRKRMPLEAPFEPESMDEILKDTREIIFPNMTQWEHPNFFSYFPMNSCSEGIVSEIFSKSFANPGFDWKCAPATTELETVVSDWCVKACGFDDKFLFSSNGGGMIINTISEGVFVNVHSAKKRKMKELGLKPTDP